MRVKKLLLSLEVFIVFLTLTVYLWHTVETNDRQKHFQTTEISANQLKNGIESFINEKISVLLQVRNFWLNSPSVSHDQFLSFSSEIISQIPGFQAIEYGDTSDRVVWIEPFVTNEPADHFELASEPVRYAALQRAIEKRTVTVTPILDLLEGGKGFVAIVPIFKNGVYKGAVFGVFKIDTLFTLIFDSVLKQRYNCAVYDGNRLVYGTESGTQSDWTKAVVYAKKTVEVRDHTWSLILWPKEYGDQADYLGIAVLILGVALAFVLGSLVWVLSSKAEQADVYAALLEVSHTLGASSDLNNVFRATGDTCLRMTGVTRCCIFLWNEMEKQFEPAWFSSNTEADLRSFMSLRLKYGDMQIVNKIVDEKRSVVAHSDSKTVMIDVGLLEEFNIKSIFAVPLLSKGNLIGAMTLDQIGKKHRFTSREQSLIEGIATQAAVAVENTTLLSETKKQADLIAKKNRELESLLFIVSHDLRNPLVALEGLSSLLIEECATQLSKDGKHYVTRIQANVGSMEHMINDVLELSRIGRTQTGIERIDVKEVLDEVLESLREQPGTTHVELVNRNQIEEISYNRHGLRHILSNLIGNAFKFSAYQQNAKVVIGSEEDEKEYRFYIQDNGIGIEKKHHQCIFDLFCRLEDLKNVDGTGVGLTIVQRVLETYGGKAWLESEKGKGSTFYFSIPKGLEVTRKVESLAQRRS